MIRMMDSKTMICVYDCTGLKYKVNNTIKGYAVNETTYEKIPERKIVTERKIDFVVITYIDLEGNTKIESFDSNAFKIIRTFNNVLKVILNKED